MILFALAVLSLVVVMMVAFCMGVKDSHLSCCEAIFAGNRFHLSMNEVMSNYFYPEHVLNHTSFTHELVDQQEMARLDD